MQTSTMTYQAATAHHTELRRTAAVRRPHSEAHRNSSLFNRLSTMFRAQQTSAARQPAGRKVIVGRFAV